MYGLKIYNWMGTEKSSGGPEVSPTLLSQIFSQIFSAQVHGTGVGGGG